MSSTAWHSTVSPDGQWVWNGQAWVPNLPPVPLAANGPFPSSPGPSDAPPAAGPYAPPVGPSYGPPAGGPYTPPAGPPYAPPAGGPYAPPAGPSYGPPAGGPYGPPMGGGFQNPQQLFAHAPFVPAKVDNTFAWFLAFWPLLYAVTLLIHPLALLVAVVLMFVCITADVKRVRAAGGQISGWSAFLLIPVYLFQRSRRLGQNYAIPLVYCVSFLLSFAIAV